MDELVTLDQAKRHLRILSAVTTEDADLQTKLDLAHAQVADYVNQRRSEGDAWEAEMDAWTEDTAPKQVLAAIYLQFGALVRFRGDDDDARAVAFDENGLAPGVAGMLRRLRDPAFS